MLSAITASFLTLFALTVPEIIPRQGNVDTTHFWAQSCETASQIQVPHEPASMGVEQYPDTVRHFLAQMRTAATCDNRETLVGLVQYPFTTYQLGIPQTTYHTPEALLNAFDQVFTEPVMAAMEVANYDELFVNDQGSMIGNGEVWFHATEEGLKIKAINSNLYETDY